ncbi:HAUS augmin-like complex subunit 1 [Geosmithia morbida]|uniref:HAUS augmin-like complex subunit 1 n=1 Tax=Geosmithia morbida TaxID=1094350 RepID=A0A9P4YT54_9HYPO|nr:HAUS augmin-like complex subunit 1 [Geosmithia morbida]KAF4121570.1 HAUS augmin-like complex subunit 1 [Geosmithia morbida]
MSHHRHLSEDAAIFSPSVARQAASAARDWSYIDSWLSAKYAGRPVPSFERNPETLQALLALAAFNEVADEERQMVSRAEKDALIELESMDGNKTDGNNKLRDAILAAVEDELPHEGQTALDAMASMAVQAGIAHPEPEDLARSLMQAQRRVHAAEQMQARVDALQGYVEADVDRMADLVRALDTRDDYRPPAHMARENLDLQRKVKTMTAQLPELQGRVAAAQASSANPRATIEDVSLQEQAYLDLLAQKKQLDAQISAFAGLPSDPDLARDELDHLRSQLRRATSQRDAVFEGLVERESPVKRRH